MAERFKFYQPSKENIQKRVTSQGGGFDSFIKSNYEFFKPQKGENWVRILPPTWVDAEHWGMLVYAHFGLGPDKGTALCPNKMLNDPCPICEYRARNASRLDPEELKDLKPREQYVAWVLDRNNEKDGPKVWSMAPTKVDQEISKLAIERDTGELIPITHPDYGFDVYFDRQGEGLRTQYGGFALSRRASIVKDKWMEFIEQHPIPSVLVWRTYEELEQLFEGTSSGGRGRGEDERGGRGRDRDDDDRPRGRGNREDADERPSRSRSRDDDERPSRREPERDERPRERERDDDRPSRRDAAEDRPSRSREPEDERPSRSRDRDDDIPRRDEGERELRGPARNEDLEGRRDQDESDRPRGRARLDDEPPAPSTRPKSRAEELKALYGDK
jgi:hypothetical protein